GGRPACEIPAKPRLCRARPRRRPHGRPPDRHLLSPLSRARAADQAPRFAVPDLRVRRPDLALPLRPAAAALHELPDRARLRPRRDTDRPDGSARRAAEARHLERLLPLLLRYERFGPPRKGGPDLVLVHDGKCDVRARGRLDCRTADRRRACTRPQPGLARPRGLRRTLGADELRAADVTLPRRG